MSNIVKVYRGGKRLKGATGLPGENGFGVSDVNASIIDNPLLDLFKNNKLSEVGAATWARAGDGSVVDRYGNYSFISGNDIKNFYDYSNDFTQWTDPIGGKWSISSTGNADPLGGTDATYLVLDATTVLGQPIVDKGVSGLNQNLFNTLSFWFRVVSGTVSELYVTIGSDQIKVPVNLSATYQRVSITLGVNSASVVTSIDPIGVSGAVFSIFGAQFENSSVLHDYIPTAGAPVSIPNALLIARSNDLGYLFEDTKTNLALYSENLSESNWTIEGGAVAEYSQPDIFGDYFKNINVTFASNAVVTIRSAITLTEGVTYTLSFFVKLLGGVLDSTTASIGGSASSILGDLLPTGYTRQTLTAVAGAGSTFDVTFISSTQNADLLLLGFQVEEDGLSSYIRTTAAANARPEDDCNLPYTLMGAGDPWSLSFEHYALINDANEKHVFNNGFTGVDEFSMYFVNDTLLVNIGGVISTFNNAIDSTFLSVTYDGSNIRLYVDGLLSSTQANAGVSGTVPTTLYIGSDESATNSLNAYMSNFKFYDSTLSANNIRSLVGTI